MDEVKLTGLKDVVAWLECQPQWSGVAVRRVDDPPIPGEPFISMESAKHLIVSAVSIMDNRRFDTEDGLVKRLKQHKPYNELVDGPLVREAAARIEALERELGEARKALKPYIKVPPISPPYWKVGMKVRFRESQEWAWSKGKFGVVNARRKECIKKPGSEYQVFYTHPLNQDGTVDTGYSWWTTPNDVDWIDEPLIDLRRPARAYANKGEPT